MARSVTEHRRAVQSLLLDWFRRHPLSAEVVELEHARGRVLAEDIRAPLDLPPFDNSQMDGYAIKSMPDAGVPDGGAPAGGAGRVPTAAFRVAAPIPAGSTAAPLAPGTAAPIMTGAMLPAGADAVVPIEQAVPDHFFPDPDPDAWSQPGSSAVPPAARPDGHIVVLPANVPAGQYVRAAGSDIARGALALPAGRPLGPAQLGLLAALGLSSVPVRRQPAVLLLTTGDEVAAPGTPLRLGQIYDANTAMLRAALEEAGVVVRQSRLLPDSVDGFLDRLAADLDAAPVDLVLSSGGISKGAYEVVRQALGRHGVAFLPVAMQPGGPQAIGTVRAPDGTDIPFLGFPGNPVSTLVSFEMFLRPALTAATGFPVGRTKLTVPLAAGPLHSPEGKHQVRRGHYDGGRVTAVGGPGSHLVHALAESNALIQLPAGTVEAAAGDKVRIWLL